MKAPAIVKGIALLASGDRLISDHKSLDSAKQHARKTKGRVEVYRFAMRQGASGWSLSGVWIDGKMASK